ADRVLERIAKKHAAGIEPGACRVESRLHEVDAVAETVAIGDRRELIVELEAIKAQPAARQRRLHDREAKIDVLRRREGVAAAAGLVPAPLVQFRQPIDRAVEPRRVLPDEKAQLAAGEDLFARALQPRAAVGGERLQELRP